MKVLVISLLRLGDFIQIVPVLRALRLQSSLKELDLLTFEPVRQMQPMVDGIKQWWTLDRDELQEGLGRADVPLLTSFSLLKEKLDQVNMQDYDCVINLTQTHFSAWIAGYINARTRNGLLIDAKGQAQFHSPWFQYLDDHARLEAGDIFHYTDIFFYGCGLRGFERDWSLRESPAGQREIEGLEVGKGETIAVQMFTSDAKKTWSEASWIAMLSELRMFRPKAKIVLLGAPNEEARVNLVQQTLLAKGVHTQSAILSLAGAFSLLKRTELLLSGDTSIKHLANAADCKILELSLGSSDWRRTGAYRSDSLILQGKAACAPCPHSAPCSQPTHVCALQLSPEVVSAAAHNFLDGNWPALTKLAGEFSAEVRLLRTQILPSGFWVAHDLAAQDPRRIADVLLERCSWKFYLTREYLSPLAQFGSEAVRMKRVLEDLFPESDVSGLKHHLSFLEREIEQALEGALQQLQESMRQSPPTELDGSVKIGPLRRERNALERVVNHSTVKIKLIRSLKSQLTESR